MHQQQIKQEYEALTPPLRIIYRAIERVEVLPHAEKMDIIRSIEKELHYHGYMIKFVARKPIYEQKQR